MTTVAAPSAPQTSLSSQPPYHALQIAAAGACVAIAGGTASTVGYNCGDVALPAALIQRARRPLLLTAATLADLIVWPPGSDGVATVRQTAWACARSGASALLADVAVRQLAAHVPGLDAGARLATVVSASVVGGVAGARASAALGALLPSAVERWGGHLPQTWLPHARSRYESVADRVVLSLTTVGGACAGCLVGLATFEGLFEC